MNFLKKMLKSIDTFLNDIATLRAKTNTQRSNWY
jgi:hypothetical protein